MIRSIIVALALIACVLFVVHDADALVGVGFKLGAGWIPDGKIPGGMVAVELGPLSPFVEAFRKSGTTTVNLGGNLIFKLPLPLVKPYGGAGGGLSRISGGGASRSRGLFDLVAGADVKLPGAVGVFGQIKYLYTFGSGTFLLRDVAFQAGVVFSLGI
ncbi:MAG: hypothetical protein EXS64_07495 [Candidatus Latescibacteria bacterium]|nr:hypothetical protein [Candidatus Latescibacterota bacterium]